MRLNQILLAMVVALENLIMAVEESFMLIAHGSLCIREAGREEYKHGNLLAISASISSRIQEILVVPTDSELY